MLPQGYQAPYGHQPFGVQITTGYSEGTILRDSQSGAIYRISQGRKCHFPNMGTYSSHGQPAATPVDAFQLNNIPSGDNVLPAGLFDGQVVRDPSGGIYMLVSGKKCHFSGEAYASHGSPAFTQMSNNVLADVVDGPAMQPKVKIIGEGTVVSDKSNGKIYVIHQGRKCHYPNMDIYALHGKPSFVACESHELGHFIDGPSILPPGVVEGQVIRDQASGSIYRVVNSQKCHYPNGEVYGAHGSPAFTNFGSNVVSSIPEGPVVLPPGLFEGQVIRDPSNGSIYKLAGGKKRHYPSMQVYQSHGSPAFTDYPSNVINSIPAGASM